MPLVSVVMPVYNGAEYLEPAVRSVLDQTMRDLELVVVDDGSSDDSLAILERLADADRRIRVDALGTNQGHHVASNRALELAEGELIARHDQDDLLTLDWLTRASGFLMDHNEVGLLGGSYRAFDDSQAAGLRVPPGRHTGIRAWLVFKNVICHPGVLVRTSLRQSGELEYRDFAGPQDYDLWVRLLRVTRGANLPELAVMYRRHAATMSSSFESDMPSEVERISDRQIEELLGPDAPDLEGRRAMRRLWRGHPLQRSDLDYVPKVDAVFDALRLYPDINAVELGAVRREWMGRVLSGSRRIDGRSLWTVARSEPRAAARWIAGGTARVAPRRLSMLRRFR